METQMDLFNKTTETTEFQIENKAIIEFNNIFNKNENEDLKLYLESKSLSEKQLKYIKYLTYKNKMYGRLNLQAVKSLNQWEAKEIIERFIGINKR